MLGCCIRKACDSIQEIREVMQDAWPAISPQSMIIPAHKRHCRFSARICRPHQLCAARIFLWEVPISSPSYVEDGDVGAVCLKKRFHAVPLQIGARSTPEF